MTRARRNITQRCRATADQRRGMLIICVLVSLVLLMALFAIWVRMLVNERDQLRSHQHRLQAEYLALSGVKRAAALLARDAAYPGETWQVELTTLSGKARAEIVIRVVSVEGEPRTRAVRATADYPIGSLIKARRSQETTIELSPGGENP